MRAQVGEPELKDLGESKDKKTKWIQLSIPVNEGNPYRVNNFQIAGNTVVKTDALMPLFKLKNGDYYSQKLVRKGFQKAQEIYGAGGYMEFTGYPDFKYSDEPDPAEPNTPKSLVAVTPTETKPSSPTVDITLRITEGKQYRVNRIIFTGNTTTRDNVIRRELRLYENNVFDTEALKYSIKRLNQLGYFKPLEGPGKDVSIDKTPNVDNKVDVKMKLEEQNRNQLTFGAGVSQFEGFFGQLSFQTSNFLGPRRELHGVRAERIARAELLGGVHGTVPVRSQHHRRRQPVQAGHSVRRAIHPEDHRRRADVRVPGGPRVHPHVHELQLRTGAGHGNQRRV